MSIAVRTVARQTVAGADPNVHWLGGDVIIVSECSEGFGSEEYREANAKLVELGGAAWLDSILPKKRERRVRAELTSLSLQSQALASRISCLPNG